MLPASIQVCPVELPGRGRRQGEPAISDVAALADVLADALPLQVGLDRKDMNTGCREYQCRAMGSELAHCVETHTRTGMRSVMPLPTLLYHLVDCSFAGRCVSTLCIVQCAG